MFDSEQAAAEALAQAVEADNPSTADDFNFDFNPSEQAPAAEATTEAPVESAATEGETPDSFTSIDPSSLAPELQQFYKQMQADYTRKTQEVAELRKLGVDPATAQEALEVFQNLQNPEFQRALYDRLGEVFTEAEATEDYSEFDDPRDAQLAELSSRIERFESQQAQAQAEAELARAEAAIRAENPTWGDDDMQAVAQLAIANGGNMLSGAEVYKSLQSRILSAHLEKKANVPATGSTPVASGHAEVPQAKFDDLDTAHKAAMAYWRQHQDG